MLVTMGLVVMLVPPAVGHATSSATGSVRTFANITPHSTARPGSRPRIKDDLIPFGHQRKRETALYSRRHYGARRWRLIHRRVIVLHFTGGNSYSSAWNTFAANAPDLGELPGVCAHFIVGRGGTIYKLVPVSIRCRHTIGLNYTAIGVEMVQPTGAGSHWADQQILHRPRQIGAALRLVKWLKKRFHIKRHNVIGHAMANASPLFKDHEGWRNTHTDWLRRDVKIFRHRLARMS
ncbi:MAG: N-acetylmuramoyl-L-alanine amidase [Actinomycetota bacterium]|nr:N-acetylmuramoyl-L-alanine amidase [Actinomycetota bacterium]